jgi:SNF2 family DNA or RNA helicase
MKEIQETVKELIKDGKVKNVLYFYAISASDVDEEDAADLARRLKLKRNEVLDIAFELCAKGILEKSGYYWYRNTYRITPKYYLPVMALYAEDKTCEVAKYRKKFEFYPIADALYDALIEGKTLSAAYKLTKKNYVDYDWSELFCTLFLYPQFYGVCTQMSDGFFIDALCNMLSMQESEGMDYDDEHLQNFLNSPYVTERGSGTGEMVALFKYIYFGEIVPLKRTSTHFGYVLKALMCAYEEKYMDALDAFDTALELFGKSTKGKNAKSLLYFPFSGTFISYAHIIVAQHVISKRQRVFRHYNEYRNTELPTSFTLVRYFANPTELMPKDSMALMKGSSDMVTKCFYYLLKAYEDGAWDKSLSLAPLPKAALLRYELSLAYEIEEGELENYRKVYGSKTLLQSIPNKPMWEKMLDILSSECEDRESMTAKSVKSTRLVYEVDGNSVIVRQQTILKSGKWSAGRALAYSQYIYMNEKELTEQDFDVQQRARNGGEYNMKVEKLLPLLVGCDRVYTKISGTLIPVRVTEEKPFIVVEKNKGGFTLKSNFDVPDAAHNLFKTPTHVIVHREQDLYVVIQMRENDRVFYENLIKIGTFPPEAEEKLKAFFPKVQKIVNVYSDEFAGDMQVETVDASTILCLQVTRGNGGFSVHVGVRLLPEGNAVVFPGKGISIMTDNVKNKQMWVKRNLEKEDANLKELKAFYGTLNITLENEEDDVFFYIDDFLQLTDFVREHPDKYSLEWKEGEALKFLKPKPDMEWDIHLNRNNAGWFELEGDITLDDDKVVTMSQLLALLSNDTGKFIRLDNDEYIVLSENLRKQIRRMEGVMVKNRGKLQLPALQAGLLTDDMLEGELKIKGDKALNDMRERVKKSSAIKPRVPKGLNATLRDYQLEGYRWIARLNNWGAGACLADDMGLGKTVQTIAYLLYKASEGASLVVAPASVVPNWSKELARFAPSLNVQVLNTAADRAECIKNASKNDVVLSTYGLLVPNEESFAHKKWNVVCLDEAHVIKNRDTKTSGVAMQLQAKSKLILTGTPVQNHLGELWNLFQFINPYLLGSYEQFRQRFIEPIEMSHDEERQSQLNALVHPFMLRRTKSEVVNELPDKEEIVIPVEMSEDELAVYESIRRRAKELVAMGGSKVSVATLAEITKLRQAACCAQLIEPKWKGDSSKVNRLVDLMQELRENGHRALVFSQFTSFFAIVRKALDKEKIPYLYLDGSVAMTKRESMVREFQEGDCPFFLISLKAGGLGLNLTGANYVIHLDPWWNPAIEQQATDRAYRIGQTQKVTAYHLVSSHTIEEKILRLHETKRNLSDAVLSGMDTSHKITAAELMEILSQEQDT